MRLALLCLLTAACSGKGTTPTVSEVKKRLNLPCEDKRGMLLCEASGDPLEASIYYRSEEDASTAKVSSFSITLREQSPEHAAIQLIGLLDGLVPAAHADGIRTRISGKTAERFDQNKPPVVIDGVEVRSGIATIDPKRPQYQVEVWYR